MKTKDFVQLAATIFVGVVLHRAIRHTGKSIMSRVSEAKQQVLLTISDEVVKIATNTAAVAAAAAAQAVIDALKNAGHTQQEIDDARAAGIEVGRVAAEDEAVAAMEEIRQAVVAEVPDVPGSEPTTAEPQPPSEPPAEPVPVEPTPDPVVTEPVA